MQSFIQRINSFRSNGFMKEWKWKINRKAAYVLIEIADTGHFQWGLIKRDTGCGNLEIESIRSQYLKSLEQRNLSKATIGLHDYVFRKMTEFAEIDALRDLKSLAPETIQLAVTKFADICNRRSMATILPIMRSMLEFLYAIGLLRTNLSGVVMGVFVQKGSVAAYISEKIRQI